MPRPKKNQVQITNVPFKKLRLEAGLSQQAVAQEIGVCLSTIRRWEKGDTEPTFTVIQLKGFCRSINTSFEQLPDSLSINKASKD